jgi:hypothetical protein
LFRSRRNRSECLPGQSLKKAGLLLTNENVGEESWMPTNDIAIPLIVSLFTIVGYILMGAALFSDWESWDVASAAYFSFITLTTIGFGDMVPNSSFDWSTFQGQIQIVITVLYVTIGRSCCTSARATADAVNKSARALQLTL